jgi:hypothetical protein
MHVPVYWSLAQALQLLPGFRTIHKWAIALQLRIVTRFTYTVGILLIDCCIMSTITTAVMAL